MPRLSKPSTGPTLNDCAREWLTSCQARNISPKTVGQYKYALDVAFGVLGDDAIDSITPSDIERLVVNLQQRGWKPASVSSVYRPLRTLLNWAVGREYIDRSPFAKVRAPVVPVVPPPAIPVGDLRALIATCQSSSRWNFRGKRDEAILRLFASTGLRLAELTNMTLADIELDGPEPHVVVLGKGRKYRSVPLDAPTLDAMRTYIHRERRRSPFAGTPSVWLAPKGAMTASGVHQMVADRGKRVGLTLHPHSLRHYAIQQCLAAGLSEGDTMAISGHSTRSMLDRYSAATRADRARAAFLQAPRATL